MGRTGLASDPGIDINGPELAWAEIGERSTPVRSVLTVCSGLCGFAIGSLNPGRGSPSFGLTGSRQRLRL